MAGDCPRPFGGQAHTKTDKLKKVVREWAAEQEARFSAGETRNPRAGEITVTIWRDRWTAGRVIDTPTTKKNDSLWRTHVGPKWGAWPMASIQREQAWVGELMRADVVGTRASRSSESTTTRCRSCRRPRSTTSFTR